MSRVRNAATIPVSLVCFVIIQIIFSSCADKIKTNIIAFEALDDALVNSNVTIEKGSKSLYASLEQKTTEPSTSERAKQWLPRAMRVQKISTNAYQYIEALRMDLKKKAGLKTDEDPKSFRESDKSAVVRLFEKDGKGEELYDHLRKYRQDILAVDADLTGTFNNSTTLTQLSFDSLGKKPGFTMTFFDDIPTIAALAMLSKFQNNIRVTENEMAAFCNNKIGTTDGSGYYMTYSAFAIISSSCMKGLEEAEITAGVGSFSKAAQPTIKINGQDVPLDEDGASHYKFKASDKAGKHAVPVEITFTDQDGKKQTINKNIEYTVANENR